MKTRCASLLIALAGCACGVSRTPSVDGSVDAPVEADAGAPRLPRDARYDFDGDGHADLVVGDPTYRGGRGAVWLIRAAVGGPLEPMLIADGEPNEHLGRFVFPVSDQDGDGRYEIGSYHSADERVWSGRWLGTRGGGGMLPGLELPSLGRRINAVASADLDADASPDIVARYGCGERCLGWYELTGADVEDVSSLRDPVVFEVPGSLGFGLVDVDDEGLSLRHGGRERPLLSMRGSPRPTAIGDVDGDGEPELMLSTASSSVVLSLGAEEVRTYETSCALGMGDRDCDGHDDVATWGPDRVECSIWASWATTGDRPTHWRAGSTDGPASEQPLPPDSFRALAHPDLDLDGCRDEAVAWPFYRLERGRRSEASSEHWSLRLPTTFARARELLWLDDVVWARSPYVAPPAFRHDGAHMVGVEAMPGRASSFGDVDGDGLTDAIEMLEGEAVFWRGRGASFERMGIVASVDAHVVGDIDGDGDDEVLLAHPFAPTLLRGGATFPAEGVLLTLSVAALFPIERLGDVDGDGREDLGGFRERVDVWLGRDLAIGDGVSHANYPHAGSQSSRGDVDGDGLDDLVFFYESSLGSSQLAVHRGRRDLPPDPSSWVLSFSEGPMGPIGPDGLALPAERDGTTIVVHRATPDGFVEQATITAPVSVHAAHFQGRLLVLPWADADGMHVYRIRDGALEGPTLITLPPGESTERPLSFSPRLWGRQND